MAKPIRHLCPYCCVRIAVLRNPKSGRGTGTKSWPAIESRLRDQLGARFERVVETEGPGTAGSQAAALANDGFDVVAVSGGDGTVNEALQGLVGSQSALAVLPLGTGNDFARTLGVGPNADLAIDALATGNLRWVDVAEWSSGDRHGYFVNVAGCGFDAAVADRINKGIRWLKGQPAYLAAIVQTLATYKAGTLKLVVDGKAVEQRAMLCAVANAKSYGGGIQVAPNALLDDGLLDLVLVGDLSKLDFLKSFPKVYKGTHLTHPKVRHMLCRELTLEAEPPTPFLVDGELIPPAKVSIKVLPKALNVVAPPVRYPT